MNKPHSDATTTRQTATHGPQQAISPDNVQMTLPANQSESNIASRARTHTCYAICSSNVQLREALGQTCLPVAHGPTVYAHQSVTLVHPASSPVSAKLLELVALSCFGVCSRIASNVYAHSTCNLVVFTASVMPPVDSIRRESHAATQDVFQQVLTQIVKSGKVKNCKFANREYVSA